jgi:hypothetical protein
MSRIPVALLAVLVLALAACTPQEPEISANDQVPADARVEEEPAEGGEGGGEAEGTPSTWVAVDVDFSEFDTELPAGPIALTLQNDGNLPHDITIEELGDDTVVVADGGETVTETVELEPGTYTFYCSVPGHRGTMEETVTVS